MYLDSQLQFSSGQALTGTAVSTNDIDLGIDQDIGKGEPMAVVVVATVDSDFTTGDETYAVDVLTDNDVAFGSPSTVMSSGVFLGSSFKQGDKIIVPIGHVNERYLRVNFALGGTTPIVTVDAYLQPMSMIDGVTDYASGYSIT